MSVNPARRSGETGGAGGLNGSNSAHTNGAHGIAAASAGAHTLLAAISGGGITGAALEAPAVYGEPDAARLEAAARELLIGVGEDAERDGLLDTPARVSKSLQFLTAGYQTDPREVIGEAMFAVDYDDLVLVRDIEFYSLCEHHLLPFFGRAHIGYIPQGRVVGLSKIPRLVEVFARRLQVQERLTREIAACIQDLLGAQGVGVVLEASHLCMMMRGVEKQQSTTRTSALLGHLRDDDRMRGEFLALTTDRR